MEERELQNKQNEAIAGNCPLVDAGPSGSFPLSKLNPILSSSGLTLALGLLTGVSVRFRRHPFLPYLIRYAIALGKTCWVLL